MNEKAKKKTNQFLKTYTKILIWSFFIVVIMNMIIIGQQNICYEVITTNSMQLTQITGINPSDCIPITTEELEAKKSFYNQKALIASICLIGIISIGVYERMKKQEEKNGN